MPLPKPNPGEERDKFVSRCISFVKHEDPSTPQDQAIAMCFSQWRRKNLEDEFNCECLKCGYKVKSEEHCIKLKCAKCGGQMRRVERPGVGQELNEKEAPELLRRAVEECLS